MREIIESNVLRECTYTYKLWSCTCQNAVRFCSIVLVFVAKFYFLNDEITVSATQLWNTVRNERLGTAVNYTSW